MRALARTAALALLSGLALSCARARPVAAGEPVDVTLPRLGGGTFSFAELRGRVVLVDVWATWCKPCLESLPFYADLQGALAPKGFAFVGVNIDEDERATVAFLRDASLPSLVTLRDPGALVTGPKFAISRMPTSFLLDRRGRVRATREGFVERDRGWYRQMAEQLLAEP